MGKILSLSMNLMNIHGSGIRKMRNEDGKEVEVICIPVNENYIYLTEKGAAYMSMVAFEVPEEKRIERNGYKSTFIFKQEIPRDQNPEWKDSAPIVGNIRERIMHVSDANQGSKYYEMNEKKDKTNQEQKQVQNEQTVKKTTIEDTNEDLPF